MTIGDQVKISAKATAICAAGYPAWMCLPGPETLIDAFSPLREDFLK